MLFAAGPLHPLGNQVDADAQALLADATERVIRRWLGGQTTGGT